MSSHDETLRALIEVILPTDAAPGGWEGGSGALLTDRDLLTLRNVREIVDRVVAELDRLSGRHGTFADLSKTGQREIVDAMMLEPISAGPLTTVTTLCMEGYYGGTAANPPAGWALTAYSPRPDGIHLSHETPATTTSPNSLGAAYDFVVIGAGAGGGVCAQVLSSRGASVLLVERGRALADSALRDDHLRGKRMATYRPTAGPGPGNPRVLALPGGREWVCDSDASGDSWGLNAMTLGGGTRLWQGMAWRFADQDFRMASHYGVPDGSTLIDWPINSVDLNSDYAAVEAELGVSGSNTFAAGTAGSRDLPMPPLATDAISDLLAPAAARLGWRSGPIPFAVNSIPRLGRPACVACHQCTGHTCPINAKNGTHNTYIPRAVQDGCDLLMSGHVVKIHHTSGTATAVDIVVDEQDTSTPRHVIVACGSVVVAAGAVETPRLLLASGLGNEHVGQHLHGHTVSLVAAISPVELPLFRGPGHSIATTSSVHDGQSPIGGGVLFDMFSAYPLQFATMARALGAPGAYGAAHKEWMRRDLGRVIGIMGMGQELPTPSTRVGLHSRLRDSHGMPAPLLRHQDHPLTTANQEYLTRRSMDWLEAADCLGPRNVMDAFGVRAHRIPASEHSAGTARMGDNSEHGATDRLGMLYGTTNVLVGDASLLPTSGGYNPALTIMANARRVASGWASSR